VKPEITLTADARARALASIRRYVAENMDQDIGDLKAGMLLDYVLAELGPSVYNIAVADARAFFEARAADLDAVCYRAEFPYWPHSGRGTR
jgi:uncharacterized protein (DUF2164 family)